MLLRKNSLELKRLGLTVRKAQATASRPCEWSKGAAKERRQTVCSSVKCGLAQVFVVFEPVEKQKL